MARTVLGLGLVVLGGLLAGCGNIVSRAGTDPADDSTTGDPNWQPGDPGYPGPGCGCGIGPYQPTNWALAQTQEDGSLEVELTNYGVECTAFGETAGCGAAPTWKVTFVIPPNAADGDIIELQENGFVTETDALDGSDPTSCGGGGGSFWDGQVVITSRDDFGIGLVLTGTSNLFSSGANADGQYYASYCGDAPPVPSVITSAVATPSADGAIDLAVSSLPNTCADPSPGGDCSAAVQNVSIHLPASMQAPGVYALDGIATFSVSAPGQLGECSGGGGSYWGGSIEVLAIDGAEVSFILSGTDDFLFPSGNANGSYVAPLCAP